MTFIQPLTRAGALNQWRAFVPKVADYAAARNHVVRGHDNVSRLSAALRFRVVLEDEIVDETLAAHSLGAAEKWLQEVYWRRYWKGWLELRPHVWCRWRSRVRALWSELPSSQLARAKQVMEGCSGVDCMDVIAQELLETGYLHNHARMWWASFWIHVERLPWELGADFFFRHLLDADPASNTLSWRWVAGLQTVGKTYLVRLSNLQKYAPDYVNGTGTGRECLAAPQVCEPRAEDAVDEGLVPVETYPDSLIFSEARRGLWIHADDLCPEKGPLSMMVPAATSAFLSERVCRERYGLSALRLAALRTALGDGVQRASDHYGCASSLIEDDDPVAALSAWAAAHRLGEIVSMAPMVGPTRDLLPRLRNRLQEQGVRLTLLRRLSDQRVFEGATAGFFPYWQKIKVHLARQLASSDTMKEGIAVSC